METRIKIPGGLPKIKIKLRKEMHGIQTYYREEEGHSWTRNGWNIFFQNFAFNFTPSGSSWGPGDMRLRQIGGTMWSTNLGVERLIEQLPTSNNDRGIVIGTSDTAFTFDDYAMGALATNATFAANAHFAVSTLYDSGTKTWTNSFTRPFQNVTGAAIDIKETGLGFAASGGVGLTARDVLVTPLTVAASETLYVTYEISKDFTHLENGTFSANWVRNCWNRLLWVCSCAEITGSGYQEGSMNNWWHGTTGGTASPNLSVRPALTQDSDTTSGILIGTGTAAFSVNDFKLATQNTDIQHNADLAINTSYDAVAKKWIQTATRSFTNTTGSAVVVSESGVANYSFYFDRRFLLYRNILPVAVTVDPLDVLEITYRMEMDFSDID